MQRNMPVCAGRRRAAAEPGPGGRDIAPAAMRPARTSPGAPSRDDGLCKKSRTVTTGQRHPRRRSETRSVMVYRLVAKDTIEEKVMALKARKARLFSSVLDDGNVFGTGLDAEDIRALLCSPIPSSP